MEVFNKITQLLEKHKIEYKHIEHKPTLTSEDSARERNEPLHIGGKAIVMKVDNQIILLVLSAAKKIDTKAIKKHFNAKKSRFLTAEELMEQTGLVPGSVPPFGLPILPFQLYLDEAILQNEKIAFNAGSLTNSIVLRMQDYLAVAKPTIFAFSKEPNQ